MANKHSKILESSRRLERKILMVKFVLSLFLLAVLVIGLSYFLRISEFRIGKILIEGNVTLGKEELSASIANYLDGKYLDIFVRDNIFVIPKKDIKKRLLTDYPRLKEVTLFRDFPNSLLVELKERTPTALLCVGKQCSFLDEEGFIFEQAPFFSGDTYVKFYDEGEIQGVKNRLLTDTQFKGIIEFIKQLKLEDVNTSKITLNKEGLYDISVLEGWKLKLNNNIDLDIALENLKLVLDRQIKDNRENLNYIDLRIDNKVFYKFK